MLLGDARAGKFSENLTGFGRTLRRAGLPVDATKIRLAQQALGHIDMGQRQDVKAALACVLVSREQDRQVFSDLFDAYFRDPELAKQLLAQLLPSNKAQPTPKRTARAQEALKAPAQTPGPARTKDDSITFDAAMTASDVVRLRHADFNQLNASEFTLIEKLVREIPLPITQIRARREQQSARGSRVNWGKLIRTSAKYEGDFLSLPLNKRRLTPLPVVILIDISGSMERYARLMLAFLHQATRHTRRAVFAFGTELTDLTDAFKQRNTDTVLAMANQQVNDFGTGTRMGHALAILHQHHAQHIVGRRSLVLLLTDGLDTGPPDLLARELGWLTRQARATFWLNPLLRYDQYQPLAAGAKLIFEHVDHMVAVHNLAHLSALADALRTLMAGKTNR
jgi:uncharacterized protein with von Willebrand factor type A (vWA) domain